MKSGVAAASLPKLITHQLLDPAFKLFEPIRLICREGKHDHLIAELAVHELDVVLTDLPIGSTVKIRAYNHLLGESDVTVFGLAPLAAKYRRGFPRSLNGAPFLLPTAIRHYGERSTSDSRRKASGQRSWGN